MQGFCASISVSIAPLEENPGTTPRAGQNADPVHVSKYFGENGNCGLSGFAVLQSIYHPQIPYAPKAAVVVVVLQLQVVVVHRSTESYVCRSQ